MMNNTKETLSSVKNVIPDIGGDFQLDPAVIESKAPHQMRLITKLKYYRTPTRYSGH